MAVADKTIDPRILSSAQQEFLQHGYQHASLKTICQKANVTTGALYKRFTGKGELFHAVVSPVIEALDEAIAARTPEVHQLSNAELLAAWEMSEEPMLWWNRFFFNHHAIFYMLLTKADGSPHADFEQQLIKKMLPQYQCFYQECYDRGLTTLVIEEMEMLVLVSTFWAAILNPIIYAFDWQQLVVHSTVICRLFDWKQALQLPPS